MAAMQGGRIHLARAVALWAVRGVAAALVLYGAYLVMARLVFAAMSGGLSGAWQVWTGVGEDHGVVRGVPMVVCGLALAFSSRWVVRWMMVAPGAGCVRCGYATGPGDERCPECGHGAGGESPGAA